MSLEKPSFTSQIPASLTQSVSDTDKYMLDQLSIIGQTNQWQIDEIIKQSKKLASVDEKITYTNGKIAQAIIQIKAIEDARLANKDLDDEVAKIVSIKKFIEKYLFNRYALIAIGIFSFGCFKIATSPEIRALFLKIIGIDS